MSKQTMNLLLSGILMIIIGGCQTQAKIKAQPSQLTPGQYKVFTRHKAVGEVFYREGRIKEAAQEWAIALSINRSDKVLQEKINKINSKEIKVDDQKTTGTSPADLSYSGRRIEIELRKAEKYYQLSQLKEAEIAWATVLTLNPEHADAKIGLEKIGHERYRYDQNRAFDTMIAELYRTGMNAYREQEWERAKMKLLEAKKLSPNHHQTNYYLGVINQKIHQLASLSKIQNQIEEAKMTQQNGQWKKACSLFEAILDQHPNEQEAIQGLKACQVGLSQWVKNKKIEANQAVKQQQYHRAKKLFNQLLAMDSLDRQARQGLADVKKRLAQQQQGLVSVTHAERKFNQGVTNYRAGRINQALVLWQEAVVLDPHKSLYREWVERGQQQLVQEQRKKMSQADSCYADGLAAYQRGEIEDALTAWKEALTLNPNHHKAKANIDRLEKELQ